MKIIYSVGSVLGVGGVGVHAGEAVKELLKSGVLEKVVCAGVKKNDSSYKPARSFLKILPVEFPWKAPGYRFFYPNWFKDTFFDLASLRFVDSGADFFHTWNGHGLFSLRKAKKLGIKTVVERNSLHPLKQESLLQKEFKKLGLQYQPTHPISLKRNTDELKECDYVATPSKMVYDSLLSAGLPKEKLWQPNALGVDFGKYVIAGSRKLADSSPLSFIFIGGDPVRKGLYYLLKAWEKLQNSQGLEASSQKLFLLGLPPRTFDSRPFLQFKGLNGVEDIGWADPLEYYQQSYVFVLPSIEDGWGLVVGEAMAAGLAVIVSENAGASDLVTLDSGFKVPAGDWQAIYEKMLYFTKNPQRAIDMGKAGREVSKKYTWGKYGKKLLENYKKS